MLTQSLAHAFLAVMVATVLHSSIQKPADANAP
jgi:hypothetical protein